MGSKIKTDAHKRLKPKKRLLSNKAIVIVKLVAATLLFFACSLFFFDNIDMFLDDIINFNPFPVLFFAGLLWISGYIINLVIKIEDKNLHLADRLDWLYKIIFIVTIMAILVRSFFFIQPLSVPIEIVVICILSGIMTLLTPRIVDNNNEEF